MLMIRVVASPTEVSESPLATGCPLWHVKQNGHCVRSSSFEEIVQCRGNFLSACSIVFLYHAEALPPKSMVIHVSQSHNTTMYYRKHKNRAYNADKIKNMIVQ